MATLLTKRILLTLSLLGVLVSCSDDIALSPEGLSASDSATDTTMPAIVGAISVSDTTIYVSFSKTMGDSAADVSNYVITQENINAEVGTLIINAAYFPAGDTTQTSVVLETSPQNEVTYRIKGSGIKDADGNPLAGIIETLGGIIDTTSITFAGSAPSLIEITAVDDGTGGITGWIDANTNGLLDSGDYLSNSNGNRIVLSDFDGDGVIDNWTDADNSGTVNAGDVLSGFQDTDGDGIADSKELYGETVFIEKANGEVVAIEVTSDPSKADTDGDGLNDLEELNIGSNPRNTDTDGDSISDYTEWNVVYSDTNSQDSDLDGLIDGLEYNFYHTSPLLADSDGDQLSDSVELLELNRDPRVADLPNLKISVGEVRLQIDERYSYTDETGTTITEESSSNTTLANSQNNSFTDSHSGTLEFTGGVSVRGGFSVGGFFGGGSDGYSAGVEGTVSAGFTDSNSWQTDSTSAEESQQVYEKSLSKGREFSTTSTVSREVVGARIDVDLSIKNNGNIPFTVSNIEVTVLQQAGNREQLLPVATLVSNSELITGTPLQVNLGAFTAERGPLLFTSREVFPQLIEAIMRNPSGLVFKVANYDVSDELGRNYVFINQVARDRTASITLDYGDADAAQNYLVATNGAKDDENIAGGGYLGGFNSSNGSSLGLPISYVLQNILQIPRHDTSLDKIVAGTNGVLDSGAANLKGDDTVQNIDGADVVTSGANGWLETGPIGDDFVANPTVANGIVAGLNKTANSIAQGDDIQLVPLDTKGLSIGTIVIDPGANGVLDTPKLDDDETDFVLGYETSRSCSALSNKPGNICRFDRDCECQLSDTDNRCNNPVPVVSGSCSGPERLVRVKSLRNGDFNRGWVVLTSDNLIAAADFDEIIVNPGEDLTMAFLQDLDKDGLFARNEFMFGSTDSDSDVLDNAEFGENFDANAVQNCTSLVSTACDDIADSRDTDHDGLDDYAEVFVGWRVAADGGALKQVFSSPRFRDTDSDGLLDPVEQDLRRFCEISDDRSDALCSFQSEVVVLNDAIGIIAGPNGRADTTADSFDVQLTDVGQSVPYGTPVVGPGTDGILTTSLVGDDLYESSSSIPPATDPSSSDTDLDGISDFVELNGFSAGLAVIDGGNGVAETEKNGDDIQRAFIDNPVFVNSVVMLPGQNGIIDSIAADDYIVDDPDNGEYIACGDNLIADTYKQGLDSQGTRFSFSCATANQTVVTNPNPAAGAKLDATEPNNYTAVADDIVGISSNPFIQPGTDVIYAGPSGVCHTVVEGDDIQTTPLGTIQGSLPCVVAEGELDTVPNNYRDDVLRLAADNLVSDPLRRDTDNDKFADGLELVLGSDPTVFDAGDFVDSDLDGLTDKEESSLGWLVSVDGAASFLVKSGPSLPDTDFDGLPDFVERDLRTNPNNSDTDGDGISDYDEINDLSKYAAIAALYPNLNIVATTTSGYGTDPTLTDTDGDGLSDKQELIDGFRLVLPGISNATIVYTQAIYADTDLDGIDDGNEIANGTDPTNPDTDGDGRTDGAEEGVSDPLTPDIAYRIIFRNISANNLCSDVEDGASGDANQTAGELMWFFTYNPSGSGTILLSDALDAYPSSGSAVRYYPVESGENTTGAATASDYSNNVRRCYSQAVSQGHYWFNINKTSPVHTLKQGESINLRGLVGEADGYVTRDCGIATEYVPSGFTANNTLDIFDETYFYDDLALSTSGVTVTEDDADHPISAACKVRYRLDIEIIR